MTPSGMLDFSIFWQHHWYPHLLGASWGRIWEFWRLQWETPHTGHCDQIQGSPDLSLVCLLVCCCREETYWFCMDLGYQCTRLSSLYSSATYQAANHCGLTSTIDNTYLNDGTGFTCPRALDNWAEPDAVFVLFCLICIFIVYATPGAM